MNGEAARGSQRRYARLYHDIMDAPEFAAILHDDHHLATWVRLYTLADIVWPSAAPIPLGSRKASLIALVDAGMIELLPHDTFRIIGLDDERGPRSDRARNAATGRWNAPANDARGIASSNARGNATQHNTTQTNRERESGESPRRARPPADAGRDESSTRPGTTTGPIVLTREAKTGLVRREQPGDRPAMRVLDRPDLEALVRRWGRVTIKQRYTLDEVLERHRPPWAAGIIEATPDDEDPFAAVLREDRVWQVDQRGRVAHDEAAWAATKEQERVEAAAIMSRLAAPPKNGLS